MTERELLRLHIEACWGISVPPIEGATSVDLSPSGALPPWPLYLARFSQEQVTLWRPDVSPERRAILLHQAQRASIIYDPALGMRREVVLLQLSIPPARPRPQGDVRLLTADDAALLEAFEAGSADYFLNPQCAPCIGVIHDGRLVSVAHSSRRSQAACALGINTLPDARRQGYAAAATTAWTRAIREEGLLPIYSALAANTASLRLAAATGHTPLIESAYGPISEAGG